VETISCQEKKELNFVFPSVLYQLFDLADRVVVNDNKYLYQLTSMCEQKPIGKNNIFTKENHIKQK